MKHISLVHTLWRAATLVLILALAYLTYALVIPYLDRRLPIFPVILLIYGLVAYILMPFVLRFWRLVVKPDHIPLYVVTPDGWPADPVNIAIVARSRRQVVDAMEKSGWRLAEKRTLATGLKLIKSIAFNTPYPNAPFTQLYLFGRPFDLGFQKPRDSHQSARARHHVRFWQVQTHDAVGHHAKHHHFWSNLFAKLIGKQHTVWLGAAIDDTGPIGLRWRDFKITHCNDPDTNRERNLIIYDLRVASQVKRCTTLHAGEPFSFYGQTIGNRFICDGQIRVVTLRSPVGAKIHRTISKNTNESS